MKCAHPEPNFVWTDNDMDALRTHYHHACEVHPWPERYPDEDKIRAAENELGEVAREMIKDRQGKEAEEWLDLAAIAMKGYKAAIRRANGTNESR